MSMHNRGVGKISKKDMGGIKMNQKEIYPWWNCISDEGKMEMYFKYYSTGTIEDCNEWFDGLSLEGKIQVYKGREVYQI